MSSKFVRMNTVAPTEDRGDQFGWRTEVLSDGRKTIAFYDLQPGPTEDYWIYAPETALEAVQRIEHIRRKRWASAEVLAGLVHAIFRNLDSQAIYPPSEESNK